MGHHYVPQRYLRQFEDPRHPGSIWLFSKKGGRPPLLASIVNVAQAPGFYDADVEAALARVEQSADGAMDGLRGGKPITDDERQRLSYYICTMLKRVPHRREQARKLFPRVREEVIADVRERVLALAIKSGADPSSVELFLAELEAVHEKYKRELPATVLAGTRVPWPSARMVMALHLMSWRVLESSGPVYFMTSDNPAFYLHAYGLAREESELCFPLSTTHALHACWRQVPGRLAFLPAGQQIVKEVNRRIADTATWVAFYHDPASWVQGLLRQTNPRLNRILWS